MIPHRVNIGYQKFGPPFSQKQKTSDTAGYFKTALYILTFCILILFLYFKLNNFSITSWFPCVLERMLGWFPILISCHYMLHM